MKKLHLFNRTNLFFTEIRVWIATHKLEFILLLLLLAIASFLRLYRIADYMTFLGDEGRDVIIVKRFLTDGDIMLIGPGTSIGNMYLGPLYYYMMAPALLLAGYSPVGPAVMVALLGIATVYFVWLLARTWFGTVAGFVAAFLYTISPTVIIYSHSSWNPNIMPFFAVLAVWAIWKVWNDKKFIWLIVASISIAASLQSHYLGLLLVFPVALFWLFTLKSLVSNKAPLKGFVLYTLLSAVVFLLLMSPLVVFDLRHNNMNFNALKAFFTERQTTVSIKPWKALPGMWPQLTQITTRLMGGFEENFGNWIALAIVVCAFLLVEKNRLFLWSKEKKAIVLLFSWLGFGLLGLALYKQQIYDHYYGFLFPAPFILLAGLLGYISKVNRFRGLWLTIVAVLLLTWVNLKASPLQYEPNRQYPRSIKIADSIVKESMNNNFNFAVIAERNYEGAYQYFLQDAPNFRVIDPQNTKDTITTQLFVVCELPAQKCDPTHNAKAEIANFGWSKIDMSWEVDGVTIYKLSNAYPSTTPSPSPAPTKNK